MLDIIEFSFVKIRVFGMGLLDGIWVGMVGVMIVGWMG